MKKFILYVSLADAPYLPEDLDRLPMIQIVREEPNQHRTIGIEQVTAAILDLASFLEQNSEYVPFRVEIWDSTEPDAVPERRRRKRGERHGGAL